MRWFAIIVAVFLLLPGVLMPLEHGLSVAKARNNEYDAQIMTPIEPQATGSFVASSIFTNCKFTIYLTWPDTVERDKPFTITIKFVKNSGDDPTIEYIEITLDMTKYTKTINKVLTSQLTVEMTGLKAMTFGSMSVTVHFDAGEGSEWAEETFDINVQTFSMQTVSIIIVVVVIVAAIGIYFVVKQMQREKEEVPTRMVPASPKYIQTIPQPMIVVIEESHKGKRMYLPKRCHYCGALLKEEELELVSDTQVRCPYCGALNDIEYR